MADELTPTTLRLYRRLRSGHPPEEALELLRQHVRIALEYAITSGRSAHAGDLRDQESNLTLWLQNVRVQADLGGRHGRFWETGEFQGELEFTLECSWAGGEVGRIAKCETAGCAIKHAFGWLREHPQGAVTIGNNRRVPAVRVTAHTTMQSLLQTVWPAF